MKRYGGIVILCLVLVAGSVNIAYGVELDSAKLSVSQQWWAPTAMGSTGAAVAALRNLLNQFCQWNGASARQQLDVDSFGLRLTGYIEGTNTTYQYVPHYGGYWVGNKYVPYTGGSTQAVQTPYSNQYSITIPIKNIRMMEMQYYSNLNRDYKWGLNIVYEDGTNTTLRGASMGVMSQVGDALATLVLASGKRLYSPTGAYFYSKSDAVEQTHRKKLNWLQENGAVITGMDNGNSPAAAAGLKPDDIILKANGVEVKSGDHWRQIVQEKLGDQPQAKLELEVFRAGQTLTAEMTAVNFNAGRANLLPAGLGAGLVVTPQTPSLGIEVRALSEDEMTAANLTGRIIVLRVLDGGMALRSGVKANDVLLELNGKAVKDVSEIKAILSSETLTKIKVARNGEVVVLDVVTSL